MNDMKNKNFVSSTNCDTVIPSYDYDDCKTIDFLLFDFNEDDIIELMEPYNINDNMIMVVEFVKVEIIYELRCRLNNINSKSLIV